MWFAAVRSQFTEGPRNIAQVAGDYVYLGCKGEKLGWVRYALGEENPIMLSTNKTLLQGNRYSWAYSSRGRDYSLKIFRLTSQDAGIYRCVYEPLPTLYREAEVVILGEIYDI